MKTCYIMRGLPGSGKSTIARKIASGLHGRIHSTDDLRMVEGEYIFDPKDTECLHRLNYDNFRDSIDLGIDPVICDNTNIRHWEFERYINYAEEMGYQVAIITVDAYPAVCCTRNTHGVPAEIIYRMAKNWEPI